MDVHWLQTKIARAQRGIADGQMRPFVKGEGRDGRAAHSLGEQQP
jgi:hypothetical protein